jgi:hypothetical protein
VRLGSIAAGVVSPISASPMKGTIATWSIIGAAVPLLWGILGFVLFTMPESIWSTLFWWSVYITCPPWLLPESALSWLITPLVNGLLYAGLACLVLGTRNLVRRRST